MVKVESAPNVVASLISIFPPLVVILPLRVIPPDPSSVTLPISVPIPATATVPVPASIVTVVVDPSLVPAISPWTIIAELSPAPVSVVLIVKSETVARVIFPVLNLIVSLSLAEKIGSVPDITNAAAS